MKVAAWFNGFLSGAMLLIAHYAVKGIWDHNRDLIITCGLLLLVFSLVWVATAVETLEKPL
jgi:hypothetical protein